MFALKKKYKDELNDLLHGLVKLIMNSLYSLQIRKAIIELYKCKPEHGMQTEYDFIMLDYSRLPNGNYI